MFEKVSSKPSSSKKQGDFFTNVPDISFDQIGGLESAKKELYDNIIMAIKKPAVFDKIGYKPKRGILLYGPPGTGKTRLAMATAKESGASFIYMSASQFKDKYYGESERKLRDAFEKAKQNAPCILFIDEIDAIGLSRQDTGGQINIVNQVLTLMDQVSDSKVFIIAATNLVDSLDEALVRPGRMFKVHVKLPNEQEREKIFRLYLKGVDFSDQDIALLARKSEGKSGAFIEEVCNQAKRIALTENNYSDDVILTINHVKQAMSEITHGVGRHTPYGKFADDLRDVS
jgi:transitional endoplasmic reticulum ATPase